MIENDWSIIIRKKFDCILVFYEKFSLLSFSSANKFNYAFINECKILIIIIFTIISNSITSYYCYLLAINYCQNYD